MDKQSTPILVCLFRATRLFIHLCYGALLATAYPHINHTRQQRTLKKWSKKLLKILNIGIQIEEPRTLHHESGCLIVANHVSWLDIFVLNAIQPARFIAKSELRDWPIIGWICHRIGTLFIDRSMRQNTSPLNLRIRFLLQDGTCVGLFPEGTTTDGSTVGHFHSSLIQPVIDAKVRLCPTALRYQNQNGELCADAAFVGDTTLIQSIWKILRIPQLNALVVFSPPLTTAHANRRVLARSAQDSITQALLTIGTAQKQATWPTNSMLPPETLLSKQSAYRLLVDPLLEHPPE